MLRVTPVVVLLILLVAASQQAHSEPDHALRGLRAVGVVAEDVDPAAVARTGMSKDVIRTRLAAALVRTGVLAVTDDPTAPFVAVFVMLVPCPGGKTVIAVHMSLNQFCHVHCGDGTSVFTSVATWTGGLGAGLANDDQVGGVLNQAIQDQVDHLTVDWSRENGRR